MYLLAYENGEYGFERSVDLQNFKKTGMAIVHLQIKTQNAYAYSSTVNFPVVKGNQYTQEMQKIKVEINI